jgi:hypothetical protein
MPLEIQDGITNYQRGFTEEEADISPGSCTIMRQAE